MGKVTKWAVDTAKNTMDDHISRKMVKWDKEHPAKAVDLTTGDLALIAVKDPEWNKHVVARAKRGYSDVDIRPTDFVNHSPMAAEALKKNATVDEKRNKERAEYMAALSERRDEIISTAIIADYEGQDLLTEVKAFCKA